MKTSLRAVTFLAVSLFAVCAAHSQNTRSWVTGDSTGDDANTCGRTDPCKTFSGAISKTLAGGEIDVLAPGGFGTVTITKAITIDGSGGSIAGIVGAGTNGIIVAAGASDVVTLRHLDINGLKQVTTPGINGVNILSAKAVHIENSVIYSFGTAGINVNQSTTGAQVFIDHVSVHDNTVAGIKVTGSSLVLAVVTNTTLTNNGAGLLAAGNSKVTVQNVTASGNTGAGFQADGSTAAAVMNILNSTSSNNTGPGVQASSTSGTLATVRMSSVATFSNSAGLSMGTGGAIYSFGDNPITGGGGLTGTVAKE